VPQRGFSVVVSQAEHEILASSLLASRQQFWLNLSMTVLILGALFWTVLDRKVEAAFVSSVRVDEYFNRGVISRETLGVLWRSEPIYYDPFVFRGALCADIKARIRDAMLVNNQGLRGFLDSQEASGIVPVGHAQYAPVLQKMQQIAPAQ
jgi:ABC-type phosphate/phosphonate transport system substrate-binding protein